MVAAAVSVQPPDSVSLGGITQGEQWHQSLNYIGT
jgi:hypothetical protein